MRKISVDKSKEIGHGANGRVYKLDDETVVKVYAESVSLEDIQRERRCAQEALKGDVPTAITFDIVECDGLYGLIFENFESGTLAGYMAKHPEEFDALMDKFIELFNKIHSTTAISPEFVSIKELYSDSPSPEEFVLIPRNVFWDIVKSDSEKAKYVNEILDFAKFDSYLDEK